MTQRIDLLDRCLGAWEDYWFLLRTLLRAQGNATGRPGAKPKFAGALENSHRFRNFLLSESVGTALSDKPISLAQFETPAEYADSVPGTVANLPLLLCSWSSFSRRIYRMTGELQAVLRATSLHRTRWEDIELPFPAFGIELEEPFRDPDGELFSLVFVYKVHTPEGESWRIQTLADSCGKYEPLAQMTKELSTTRATKGKLKPVRELVDQQIAKMGCIGGYSFALTPGDRRELVQRTSKRLATTHKLSEGANLAFEHMIRTVVGLMLYLRSLPPGSPHVSAWTKRHLPRSKDPLAVTREAELCDVSSIYTLTPEERELMESSEDASEHPERAMSAHFRAGHWRRRRGTGDDPNAPKVEHVRWTIVRRDRLPPGGLPHGTIQELRP